MGRRWGIIPTRGVYQGLAFSGALTSGSSPLARGLHLVHLRRMCGRGIIPARAGFTQVPAGGLLGEQDHPRSRGVYSRMTALAVVSYGSSPLARGLRARRLPHGVPEGIIPARAGFTRAEEHL